MVSGNFCPFSESCTLDDSLRGWVHLSKRVYLTRGRCSLLFNKLFSSFQYYYLGFNRIQMHLLRPAQTAHGATARG
jgi:hypothetical protein